MTFLRKPHTHVHYGSDVLGWRLFGCGRKNPKDGPIPSVGRAASLEELAKVDCWACKRSRVMRDAPAVKEARIEKAKAVLVASWAAADAERRNLEAATRRTGDADG